MPAKPLHALRREVAGDLVRSTDRTTIAGFESEYQQFLEDGLIRPYGTVAALVIACNRKLIDVRAEIENDSFSATMELLISEIWRAKIPAKR